MAFDLQIKVLTIGDSSVGKTCLLHRYTSHTFSASSIPTVGIDFKIMTITIDGKRIKMQCWDTAGQERYRNITANYYRNAQGIMLVYDVTNKKSFEAIDNWMEQIHVHAGDSIDKILVGNKVDQETERKVSNEQGKLLAQKYKLPFIETSAKLGVNVDEAFYAIAKSVMTRLMANPTDKGGGVSLSAAGKAETNAPLCC
jgi:small GTP-binding protein